MSKQGYVAYEEAQAQELDQAKLILMMYAGGINFLNRALKLAKTDKKEMSKYISKTKDVILELMSSLNIEESGEMGLTLFHTYRGLFNKLNIAHIQENIIKISEVRDSLIVLEDVWKQVFKGQEYQDFKNNSELFRLRLMGNG